MPRCVSVSLYVLSSESAVLLLLQELVEDVDVATSSRHADLSWARRFAVASPRFIGRRSASTVLSQDCLGRPGLRLQSAVLNIIITSMLECILSVNHCTVCCVNFNANRQ